jgi:ribose transport system substrate-binding protein
MTGSTRGLPRAAQAAATLVCVALVTAACGGSSSAKSSGSSDSAAAGVTHARQQLNHYANASSTFTPPGPQLQAASLLKGKTVWFVPITFEAPIFLIEAQALRTALEPLGAKLQVCDGKGNPTTTSGCITQAISNGAAGIITDAIAVPFAQQAYAAAVDQKIPVVANDNVLQPPATSNFARYFTGISDGIELNGQLIADMVIADSAGKADVLFVNDTTTPLTQAAGKALLNEFATYCPGCKLSTVEIQDTALQKVPTQVQTALITAPSAHYVVTQFDAPSGQLVVQGASQGRPGVQFVASGGQLAGLQRVQGGIQLADPGVDPVSGAWAAVDGLLRILAGKPAGKYDDAVLHRVFTQSNIGKTDLTQAGWSSGSWYSTGAFESGYLKLWGVS